MNKQKMFDRFERHGKNISRAMHTNFKLGEKNMLPYWDGLYTIKIDHKGSKEEAKGVMAVSPLQINETTTFKGYLESTDANVIHFISPQKKMFKNMSNSFYHAMADDIAEVVLANQMYPNAEFIFGVGDLLSTLGTSTMDFFTFFLECLDKKNIKYTLVDFTKFDLIYADNFYDLVFPFHSGARLDLLGEFFQEFVTNKDQKPEKKIYVSRRGIAWRPEHEDAINFPYISDNRIDSHDTIEALFASLGFEIVVPELLKSFQEQLDIFYSAKTIASVTSSGITNAIFMQPGGTVIELITPLITKSPNINDTYIKVNDINIEEYLQSPAVVQELHMFYQNLAFFREHLYIGIPNNARDTAKIKEFIDAHPALRDLVNE